MIDPTTLILTALINGAAQAAASEPVKDAYVRLKDLIRRKFGGKPEREVALDKYEEKPQVWTEPLKDGLTASGADQDEEVIRVAQELMAKLDPDEAAKGKYNTEVHGNVYGMIQGDHGQITMTFDNRS